MFSAARFSRLQRPAAAALARPAPMVSRALSSTSEASAFVDSKLEEASVMMFSKTYCPHCRRAKNAITNAGYAKEMLVVELDEMENAADVEEYLLEKTGQRTVPNIFVKSTHIGDCGDILVALGTGAFENILKGE